ncbi:hypothetical protein ABZX85_32895 [Streptomyces sp. NPDC004539]|uniref:hypothetical protein n=1 Tax=Streptomyces sp. NPDC004539 TaxID=3154280 RepID=UPI00339F80AC
MFKKRHGFVIVPAGRGRVRYSCSCGAEGWTSKSSRSAYLMGKEHVAKAEARAKRK